MSTHYPITRVQLPSRGLLYDGRLSDGFVEIRPMTAMEERLLLNQGYERSALFSKLLDACLITKEVPAAEMLTGDRFTLLFHLRNISYGSDYRFPIRCKYCGTINQKQIQVPDDLTITMLEDNDTEPYVAVLPNGTKVGLRYLRGKDEMDIVRYSKRANDIVEDNSSSAFIYAYAIQILTLDDRSIDRTEAISFVSALIGKDRVALQYAIEDNAIGLDMSLAFRCSSCGADFEEDVPLGQEFFRPSMPGRKRRKSV